MGTGGNATLHFYSGKYAVSTDCIVLFPDNRVRCKYLYYFFLANMALLEAGFKGAGLKHTNKKYIGNIELKRLPSHKEQDDIVNILNRVTQIIQSRKVELERLDDLIRARFVELFGNPIFNEKGFETKLGSDVFNLSNGKFVPESKRFEDGVPVYGGNGVSWYTDEILFENETIVVGRVGFQSGNVHLVNGPLWISDNAMYISKLFDKGFDLRFLYFVMEHIDFTRFQDAGDLKKITQKPFMETSFIKPPLSMQLDYIAFVAQINKSKFAALIIIEFCKKAATYLLRRADCVQF